MVSLLFSSHGWQWLKFIISVLDRKTHFEIVQAYLSLFLRIHSSELTHADDEVYALLALAP